MKHFTFIDIFAGAGGLAEGFIENGFFPVAHVEMNKDACHTLETRLAYHYLKKENKLGIYYSYLEGKTDRVSFFRKIPNSITSSIINEKISEESIDGIFTSIRALMKPLNTTIDVLVGGPPCQAYSMVGRSSKRVSPLEKDEKNYLYRMYAKFLEEFKPKVFVFENVLGILSAKQGFYYKEFLKLVEEKGYIVEASILNSEEYGVLQRRKRVIVVGCLGEIDPKTILPKKINTDGYTVNDLLSDLPPLINDEMSSNYCSAPSKYLQKFFIRTKDDVLTWHVKRTNNNNDKAIYKTAIKLWDNKRERLKYSDLPAGLKTHKNVNAFLDRYKVVASNEHSSHTMLAHISKDGHYFIHPDIKQCRSISVREAARIQSFPDSYFFEGSRCAAFTQIGNAVPPLMAKQIAKVIKEKLEDSLNDSK